VSLDADQDAQPAGVAERHSGQVDDEQAGVAPDGAQETFAHRIAGGAIELTVQADDGGGGHGGDEPQTCPRVGMEGGHGSLRSTARRGTGPPSSAERRRRATQ
jgi:hypothetical protein